MTDEETKALLLSEEERDIIDACIARREIEQSKTGYFYYWPSVRGCVTSFELRTIAAYLDSLNEEWDKLIEQSDEKWKDHT